MPRSRRLSTRMRRRHLRLTSTPETLPIFREVRVTRSITTASSARCSSIWRDASLLNSIRRPSSCQRVVRFGPRSSSSRNSPAASSSLVATEPVSAHGFAGKRFFPATLATDDPFVADELSLPTIAYSKQPASEDSPATRQTDFSIDLSKRVTENFGVGFGATYKRFRPDEGE